MTYQLRSGNFKGSARFGRRQSLLHRDFICAITGSLSARGGRW